MKNFIFISILSIIIVGCTFHNEEDYFEVQACDSTNVDKDTINVVFDDLAYIFSETCLSCHNSGFSYEPGIVFDSYDDVVNSINTGKVIPAIKHETVQMPKDQAKLSNCNIQLIEIWVERGMPK